MSWIKEVPYEEASGNLKKIYDRVKGPNNNIDNILKVHSLRPHSLSGHMALYKNVLHNTGNTLPKWYLEVLGVYVSLLNDCPYCVNHHSEGLRRLLDNEDEFKAIKSSLDKRAPEMHFNGQYLQGIRYAKRLTKNTSSIQKQDIEDLRLMGLSDGEILEINQVVSYFNYANRTVLGLGVNSNGDVLGLSPNDSDDEKNWNHT